MSAFGKTQSEIAYDQIRNDVMTAVIRPGSRLKISDYVVRLDVRLGAVREALSKLSSEGWVVAEPQRGFRAAPITKKELLDLTSARVEIETYCLKQAIGNGNFEWEGQILASIHSLGCTPEYDNGKSLTLTEEWVMAHANFHHALVAACDNEVMLTIRKQLYQQAERYRRLSAPLKSPRRNVIAEHRQLAKTTIARDVKAAHELMCEHLNHTADILIKGLEFPEEK